MLVIEAPPRHGKSELICRYLPTWYLGTWPDRRVLLCMHSETLARGYGRKARDLMEEHGPPLFGVSVREDSSAANDWGITGHDGAMATAGVGTGIPGRGANLLIIDDPIAGPEAAMSDLQREKQWDWWQSSAEPRLEPGGCVIVIATRWHEDDLSGRLIKNDNIPVRRVRLPAIAEESDTLGREPGSALWPERWPLEALERKRAGRSVSWWNALYQQRPGRHEGAEWPDSYFGDHLFADPWPGDFDLRCMAIDPSKGRQRGDYSAIVFAGLHDGLCWIDASIERRPAEQIVTDAIAMSRRLHPQEVTLEANQWQDLLAPEFDRQAKESRMRPLPIRLLNNTVAKEVRIGRLGPFLARSKLRFRDTPGCRLLVQQLREFPLSEHDDGPDALEMAVTRLGQMSQPKREAVRMERADTAW